MADVDELSQQASEIALRNPPSRVLENLILGTMVTIGWVAGRSWFYGVRAVAFLGLAVRHGYRKGNRTAVAPAAPAVKAPDNLTQVGPNVHVWSEPGS